MYKAVDPLVSIITPIYNAEMHIIETIKSVLNQTYTNWELILVDDCSTDKSVEIISKYVLNYSKIYLFQNTVNSGAAITRNKGTKEAKGKYIAFLDADDIWSSKKLKVQIDAMEIHKTEVSFSSYALINEQGKPLNKMVKALDILTYKKLLKCNYIGNLTGVYNAEALGKIYTKNLRKRQDWLLWLEAVHKTKEPVIGIQESLAKYRVQSNSMSSNKLGLIKYNYWVYKQGLDYSTLKSIFSMILFLKEYFFVKGKNIIDLPKT